MSTNDVPGANPANADILKAGCWAKHDDGSLIFVKGNEKSKVIFEIYDVAQKPVTFFQDAMDETEFKEKFSFPPIGKSKEKWTWHDKTPFPWDTVIKMVEKPQPMYADVKETISAAARVAESLRSKVRELQPEDIENNIDKVTEKGKTILERLERAFKAFSE